MKIAINTRLLLKDKLEGIGWYTYEIVKRMTNQHPEHDFYFLFDRPFSSDFVFAKNVKPIVLAPQARHPLLWYFWFEFSVSKFLRKRVCEGENVEGYYVGGEMTTWSLLEREHLFQNWWFVVFSSVYVY